MIFKEDCDSIRERNSVNGFLYPNYKEKCISNLPGTILNLFGIKTERSLPFNFSRETDNTSKVVLFVLDGFGYNQFFRHIENSKFLASLSEKADIFPLTSVFPSQTTNALTTLNTGLTPQEHGLFEYYLYIKEVDQIVSTLSFDPLGSKRRNVLVDKGFNPKVLYNGQTIQKMLRLQGVKTFTHIYSGYAYSNYSQIIFGESTIVPNLKTSDLVVNLRKTLEKANGPAYFFVHLSNLDTIAHEYGPQSYEYGVELSAISYLLRKELVEKINYATGEETLLLLTSDHGGVEIDPRTTTYLNKFPKVVKNLKFAKNGKRILPTGSARDVFLHIKEDRLMETKELLEQKIGSKARIVLTQEAINEGLFGLGDVGKEFSDRVGNCLILPYNNETVWFEHSPNRRLNLRGHHGGLTEEEMIVPLAVTKLNKLK